MSEQEWHDIPGKQSYQITVDGRVKRLSVEFVHRSGVIAKRKEKILHRHMTPNGYLYYSIFATTGLLHRLLAITFIPNPNSYEQINHKNGNKHDNRLENLEWCTAQHNLQHRCRVLGHNIGAKCRFSKFTEDQVREIRELWSNKVSQVEIARRYGTIQSTIQKIVNRKTWAHLK